MKKALKDEVLMVTNRWLHKIILIFICSCFLCNVLNPLMNINGNHTFNNTFESNPIETTSLKDPLLDNATAIGFYVNTSSDYANNVSYLLRFASYGNHLDTFIHSMYTKGTYN